LSNGTIFTATVPDTSGSGTSNISGSYRANHFIYGTNGTNAENSSVVILQNGTQLLINNTLNVTQICLIGDGCRTTWPTSGAGGGNITGSGIANFVPYWTNGTNVDSTSIFYNSSQINISTANLFIDGYPGDHYDVKYTMLASSEFCTGTTTAGGTDGSFRLGVASSGTIAGQAAQPNHPCLTGILDSTTINGGGGWITDTASFRLNGTENGTAIFRLNNNAKVGTTTIRYGFFDSVTITQPADGCYMQFSLNNTDQFVNATCRTNSVSSVNATSFTVVNNSWYIGNIVLNDSAGLATFKLYNENGTIQWAVNISANIPTSAGRETGYGIFASQNTTDAASVLVLVDYMDLKIRRQTRPIVFTQ
jgi:hypothetical protein